VRFWDSSAIIPLCVAESSSDAIRVLVETDEEMAVWWETRVECASALSRRRREGALSVEAEVQCRAILRALSQVWSEVQPSEMLRQRAERLLMVHPLRAADAFQLAAALVWGRENPMGLDLISLDENLRQAALREGFNVLP
jgi:uncharacterized protein